MSKFGKFAAACAAVVCAFGVSAALLPAEYQEVEWIESTGSQYIDVGFMPDQNKTGIEMSFNSGAYQNDKAYMGTAWGNNRWNLYMNGDNIKFRGSSEVVLGAKSPNCDMTLTIVPNGDGTGVLTLDNPDGTAWKTVTKTVGTNPYGNNLNIFAANKNYFLRFGSIASSFTAAR